MAEWRKNMVYPLKIQGYTAEGAGVARLDGRVVFVPNTIRGEEWEVALLKVNKNYAWGQGVRLLTSAPQRVSPDCPAFGRCGGCQYRHMTYAEELYAKDQRVSDALKRLAGVDLKLPPVLGASQPDRYRNKVQFPVAMEKHGLAIGFYRARSHNVINVEDCLLQPPAAAKARRAVKKWMQRYNIPPYDETSLTGLVRHLYLRCNQAGQVLCCLVINGQELPRAQELTAMLRKAVPQLVGLVLNVNTQATNVILGEEYHTLWGCDSLEEQLCGMSFTLSVPSFFQVNLAQTERLYSLAVEFAGLTGKETVLDLYCGIGTISLCMARRAGRVIGAEIVPQAIEDARENARRNGIRNVTFFCGDAGEVARKMTEKMIRPQVICVDPPRKGLSPQVPVTLAALSPDRIVYVSCDSGTLARDIRRFADLGYQAVRAQAVDLFPRTAHVETVVLLSRVNQRREKDV